MWQKKKQPTYHPLGQWVEIRDVQICVHSFFETFREAGRYNAAGRFLYLDVEYRNGTDGLFRHTTSQWSLHDKQGYKHESKFETPYYEPWGFPPLRESRIAAYQTIRGWVAVTMSADAKPHYLHFQEHYGHDARMADFLVDTTQLSFRKWPKGSDPFGSSSSSPSLLGLLLKRLIG